MCFQEGPLEIWSGPLDGDARAVVLFNRHHAGLPEKINVAWAQLGYKPGFKAAVRDLYAEKDLGVFEQGFTVKVANYDVAVLRISHPVKPSTAELAAGGSSRWQYGSSSSSDDSLLPFWWSNAATSLSHMFTGITSGNSGSGSGLETVWRPWHDAAAAQLQASIRAAAAAGRQQRLTQRRQRRQVSVQVV
jgi:hypothetical protein